MSTQHPRDSYAAAGRSDPRIFVLGDSRTGTTSLHTYFEELGIASVHHYVEEAGITDPYHVRKQEKWKKVRRFINESGYAAFSDYPTRFFFRELITEYPYGFFILTVRSSIEVWKRSVTKYFGVSSQELDQMSSFYTAWNEEIRLMCVHKGVRFLEICIDEGSEANAARICGFLGHGYAGPLPSANTVRMY